MRIALAGNPNSGKTSMYNMLTGRSEKVGNWAALACLMFNLFTPPCFAALGAMNSEMKDRKWFWAGVGLQFATGYVVAYLVYQIGTLITEGILGTGFVPGLIVNVAIVAVIVYIIKKQEKKFEAEYALKK
jgi:ferrous iron transport protein B